MSDQRFMPPPVSGHSQQGTKGCPCVADLIHYALGQAAPDERQRIEAHLQNANCGHCRSWIEKAGRLGAEPWSGARSKAAGIPASPVSLFSPHPTFAAPAPPSDTSPWQQEALRDLERRLQLLDEEEGKG